VEALEAGEVVFADRSAHPSNFEDALRRIRELCQCEPTRIWLANEQATGYFFRVSNGET
jgi:hypothetical protein